MDRDITNIVKCLCKTETVSSHPNFLYAVSSKVKTLLSLGSCGIFAIPAVAVISQMRYRALK